jgi:hypothetical protein
MTGEPFLTLRDMVRTLVPRNFQQKFGYGFLYSLATLGDTLYQMAVEAARVRFPSSAPDDALPYHGRDRGVARGPEETRDQYVARLLAWRDTAKRVGHAHRIIQNVQDYDLGNLGGSLPSVTLVTNTGTWFVLDSTGTITRTVSLPGPSNWDWDSRPDLWDRFWIVLYADEWEFGNPPQQWARDGTWGDGELWGNDGTSTIGSTATPVQVQEIRQRVADAQGADARCVSIIISFDDTAFKPDSSGTLPDGLWEHHGKIDGMGNVVIARSEDALYWDGTS